jgi:hypothetical protein
MKITISNMYAPKCVLPDCCNRVGYHTKTIKKDGTPGFKWKTFCDYHRTVGKKARDIFMKSKGGCENRFGDIGLPFTCGDPDTPSLTVDHWDGNKHNNDQDNLKILCECCHARKTKLFKDTTKRYKNYNENFDDFF